MMLSKVMPGLTALSVAGIEQPAIARVAQHEPVLGVVEDEALRDALDRLDEALLAHAAGVLGRLQRGDVVDPQHALAAGEADVTAVIGDLHVGQEDVHRLAVLRLPGHLLVQELAAALAQAFDDAGALVEVVPEPARVEQRELVGVIAEQLAQAGIVEQKPAVLIDDIERRRAIFEDLTELPLLLGDLRLALAERRDVVDPQDALAADEADVAAAVGDLGVGDQHMDEPALLGLPDRLLVEELAAALAQPLDDPGPVVEVVPEPPRVEEVHLLLVIAHELAQSRVVEQQPPVLVDDVEAGRAIFEDLAELALVLGDLGGAPVVDECRAAVVRRGGPVIGHRCFHLAATRPRRVGVCPRGYPTAKPGDTSFGRRCLRRNGRPCRRQRGVNLRATRKPMMPLRKSAGFLSRLAERSVCGALFQDAPL